MIWPEAGGLNRKLKCDKLPSLKNMDRLSLQAEERKILGKKVKNLRKDGKLPGHVFGKGLETEHVSVDGKTFLKTFKEAGETGLIDLKIGTEKVRPVMVREVQFDPVSLKTQLGTVFASGDLTSVASILHRFSKELVKSKKGDFGVIAAYDSGERRLVDANEFKAIATLPSREILLAQIAMMLTMPLKQMMMALNERSKKL